MQRSICEYNLSRVRAGYAAVFYIPQLVSIFEKIFGTNNQQWDIWLFRAEFQRFAKCYIRDCLAEDNLSVYEGYDFGTFDAFSKRDISPLVTNIRFHDATVFRRLTVISALRRIYKVDTIDNILDADKANEFNDFRYHIIDKIYDSIKTYESVMGRRLVVIHGLEKLYYGSTLDIYAPISIYSHREETTSKKNNNRRDVVVR